jgi:hypothetical protein
MPLPSPSGKEERSKFVSRCVSDLTKKGEGKDAAQRVAICNSRFKKSEATMIDFTVAELESLGVLMDAMGAGEYSAPKEKKKKKKQALGSFITSVDKNGFTRVEVNL